MTFLNIGLPYLYYYLKGKSQEGELGSENVENPFGGVSALTFPSAGHYTKLDNLGLVLQMEAFGFQNYHIFRAENGGQKLADIVLPAPNQLNTTNAIDWGVEEGISWNFSPSFWEEFDLSNFITPGWRDEANNRTKIRDSEARFKAPNLRSFTYSWNLVPKETGDAEKIAKICKTLQTMAYPTLPKLRPDSRFSNPPMWIVKIVDVATAKPQFRWDMGPMPSILSNVTVSPTVAGGVYTHGVGGTLSPVATHLSLTFIEIDMAVASGTNKDNSVPHLIPLGVARNIGPNANNSGSFIRDDI